MYIKDPESLNKAQSNFRLSEDARLLLADMKRKLGVSKAALVEMAIRVLAEREGVR